MNLLTDEEIAALWNFPTDMPPVKQRRLIARAIEAAVLEKVGKVDVEPVALVTSKTKDPDMTMSWWHEPALPVGTKLYTAPRRKPMTDEEIRRVKPVCPDFESFRAGIRFMERELGIIK